MSEHTEQMIFYVPVGIGFIVAGCLVNSDTFLTVASISMGTFVLLGMFFPFYAHIFKPKSEVTLFTKFQVIEPVIALDSNKIISQIPYATHEVEKGETYDKIFASAKIMASGLDFAPYESYMEYRIDEGHMMVHHQGKPLLLLKGIENE